MSHQIELKYSITTLGTCDLIWESKLALWVYGFICAFGILYTQCVSVFQAAFFSAERDIMAWGKSPWLTSLHYAFQDSTSLYLVMDYHPGGDLLNIMERKDGSMHEDEVRYARKQNMPCIIQCLETKKSIQ